METTKKKVEEITVYTVLSVIIGKIFKFVLHMSWVFIRMTVYWIVRLLYKILSLEEIDEERGIHRVYKTNTEVVEVIDELNHTFNFQRSPEFKDLFDDYKDKLKTIRILWDHDKDNLKFDIEEQIEEINDDIAKLIVIAEQEAHRRGCESAQKFKTENGMYSFGSYMYNEELRGYNNVKNEIK